MTKLYPILALVVSLLVAESGAATGGQVSIWFLSEIAVNDTVIRLGDIAQRIDGALDTEVPRAVVIGDAAPAGFSRLLNTDELCAGVLASRLGVKTIVNKTPGRIRISTTAKIDSVGAYEALIRSHVLQNVAWSAGQCRITVLNAGDRWQILDRQSEVKVVGADNTLARGSLRLKLIVTQGTRSQTVAVQCRLEVQSAVAVASRSLSKGEIVQRGDIVMELRDITAQSIEPYTSSSDIVGLRARRTIAQGIILNAQMVEQVPLITTGEQVRLLSSEGRVKLSVLAIARENGHLGEPIWLINQQSRRLVRAVVTGKNSAVITGTRGAL